MDGRIHLFRVIKHLADGGGPLGDPRPLIQLLGQLIKRREINRLEGCATGSQGVQRALPGRLGLRIIKEA
ncbi:hypothetical protein D3C78_1927950 [compost metagenome]